VEAAHVKGIQPSDVKINMTRLTGTGDRVSLEQGGTVVSSFLGESDNAVIVSIENQPTKFMEMRLNEDSEQAGDILIPQGEFYPGTKDLVVFPGSRDYFYKLAENAEEGEFEFELHGSPQVIAGATAHIATDYLYFHCTSGTCPNYPNEPQRSNCCQGNLEFRRGDGTLIPGLGWTSISGPHRNGRLDDCNYRVLWVNPIGPCTEPGFRDGLGQCWWAPIQADIQRGCTVRRTSLGIHPDGYVPGNPEIPVGTAGCIGISHTIRDTSPIHRNLYNFRRRFGPIRLIVGP